jgi:hypothetical protein
VSGIEIDGRRIMKGAIDAVARLATMIPSELTEHASMIATLAAHLLPSYRERKSLA